MNAGLPFPRREVARASRGRRQGAALPPAPRLIERSAASRLLDSIPDQLVKLLCLLGISLHLILRETGL